LIASRTASTDYICQKQADRITAHIFFSAEKKGKNVQEKKSAITLFIVGTSLPGLLWRI
jgi:hypothetical protein